MAFGCAIGTNSTRIDSAVPPHPLKVTRIERAVGFVVSESVNGRHLLQRRYTAMRLDSQPMAKEMEKMLMKS